jgi:hypothetical protein
MPTKSRRANHEEWMAIMKASEGNMGALVDVSLETTEFFLEKI